MQDLQADIQLKLGRFMLRVQKYERLLKALLIDSLVVGTVDTAPLHQQRRMELFAAKPMGYLVDEINRSYPYALPQIWMSDMNREHCPICGSAAETGHTGDALQVRCPRCGPFTISGTAAAMLSSRISGDPKAAARASHAVRVSTSEESWFAIDSTNVDDLVSRPLPEPRRQVELLMEHLQRCAGEAHFAPIEIGSPDALAAILGAAGGEALPHLIEWAAQEALLRIADGGKSVILTPKAWSSIEEVPSSTEQPSPVPPTAPKERKSMRGHCPSCGPERHANVQASHEEKWHDDELSLWGRDTYSILKCGGCDTIYVRHDSVFSEDVDYRRAADGSWEQYVAPNTSYWPAPARRKRPDWLGALEDEILRTVLDEVYGALDADHRILAAIGARTSLDRAMTLLGVTADSFPGKLKELETNGLVSARERDDLLVLTDAGSASAHRAWHPTAKNIDTIMSGMESFLHRTLVLGKEINAVKKDIPPRLSRAPKQK